MLVYFSNQTHGYSLPQNRVHAKKMNGWRSTKSYCAYKTDQVCLVIINPHKPRIIHLATGKKQTDLEEKIAELEGKSLSTQLETKP